MVGWLLPERPSRERTSTIRAVVDALSRNEATRKRHTHIFSDGMGNSPEVVSFYDVVNDAMAHAEPGAELCEFISCLVPVSAGFEMPGQFPAATHPTCDPVGRPWTFDGSGSIRLRVHVLPRGD